MAKENSKTFFDVAIQGKPAGRIEFELFDDVVPKTAANFRGLCLKHEKKEKGYKNCVFHRIIPDFMVQGGDFENHNGTGGCSIYGSKFDDENFFKQHTGPGLLSMANSGKNTNRSQFFITLKEAPWLDGKHVVFGQVSKGMDVLKKLEEEGSASGQPKNQCVITNCGEL